MIKYTIISGSVRLNRNTHRVSLYLHERLNREPNSSASIIDLASKNIPLLDDYLDKHPDYIEGYPELLAQMQESDAFIWVSPEYNGSFSPALKNFIDGFPLKIFTKKPVAVVSVSTGSMGGIRGGLQMQSLALAIQAYALPYMLLVPQVTNKFTEEGQLIDEGFNKQLDVFIQELSWMADAIKQKREASIKI